MKPSLYRLLKEQAIVILMISTYTEILRLVVQIHCVCLLCNYFSKSISNSSKSILLFIQGNYFSKNISRVKAKRPKEEKPN